KKTSGKDCVKILCNKFGFIAVRQTGSHIIFKKIMPENTVGTVVPNHKVLKNSKRIFGTPKISLKIF
ncbi:MAG: type II toxin-antitoxin system HicA family toxin, partial [Nanoarchaeota archaeon]|nr:type II toxin-antitoxin system HicA family toxin [Nanoarchaeota archaeon]